MKFLFLITFTILILANYSNGLRLASKNEDFKEDKFKVFHRSIKFENAILEKVEQNLCTYIKLSSERQYITEIQINGFSEKNHHISMVACEHLDNFEMQTKGGSVWDCGKQGVCAGKSRRLYTWALDAEGVNYEKGVGYRVSGDTGLRYLAIQSHYNDRIKPGELIDNDTSYELTLTTQDLPYQVGVYTLGDNGHIPPRQEKFHLDAGCKFHFAYDIVPINYRTHAHNIIPVISAYVVKRKKGLENGNKYKWIEIGRMSPKQPEQFYDVTNKDIIVNKNDYLVSRCTANSLDRDFVTHTGHKHADEMCVFYLMFYTDFKGNLKDYYCYYNNDKEANNEYNWEDSYYSKYSVIPETSDNLDGVILPRPEYEYRDI